MEDGHWRLDDLDLVTAAQTLKTPLYIYSAAQIEANARRLRAAFSRSSHIIRTFFAAQACGSPAILRLMFRLGMDVEVSSGGELRAALAAGFSPRQILFNGESKTDGELRTAVELDIAAVVVDSLRELQRLATIGAELHRCVGVSLRLDLGVASKAHSGLATGGDVNAGVSLADAFVAFEQAVAAPGLRLVGIHFNIGSQVASTQPHRQALHAALDFLDHAEAACGVRVQHIDIGGGFAIPCTDTPPNGSHPWFRSELTAADYADAVFAELAGRRDDVQLFVEPGRALVGNAAVLLSSIVSRKSKLQMSEATHTHWLFVDAGFTTLLGAAANDCHHQSVVANRASEPHAAEFRLAGPLRDGGDLYPGDPGSPFRLLPVDATVGDVIAFLNAGAYTWDTRGANNGRFPANGYLLWDGCLVPM